MGIFGQIGARQRLRRATQESLTMPTFSVPFDCTPWVIGDLWPGELSPLSAETATLAQYLKADLQRIADSANADLRAIGSAGMTYSARRTAEARVIDEARARAMRRVESTMRHFRHVERSAPAQHQRLHATDPLTGVQRPVGIEQAQALPGLQDVTRPVDMEKTQVIPAVRDTPQPPPVAEDPAETTDQARHIQQLLAIVAVQEPRLSWAVGERTDGSTVLVTDIAHGWIPPGIAVPEGVCLLEPQRHAGRTSQLLGITTRAVTYAPGDRTQWSTSSRSPKPSVQPLELPTIDDLDWDLGVATHWRDGLPTMVNGLVKAAAAGTEIVEQEVDLLRVHLDVARNQLVAQYPDVDPAALLNCMLLAATEARVTSNLVAANYHFAWFKAVSNSNG